MVVNDDAAHLTLCGGLLAVIAGKPAPTGWGVAVPVVRNGIQFTK